jgi:DNA-binding transcriptional MerR regulator
MSTTTVTTAAVTPKRARKLGRPLLTPGDIALALGVTIQSVYVWIRKGQIVPSFQTMKGISLFHADDVERFKAARDAR